MTTTDRIHGSLLGLAWGDVLGCPVECWREADIQRIYGHYDRLPAEHPVQQIAALWPKEVGKLRPLGLYSDDTQQALALIAVALEPTWSVATWAAWLVAGMEQNVWRGYGRNFIGAVTRLRQGQPPQRAGSSTAGIGAAMRIGPLGALFHDRPALLAKVVMESSLVTHGDIRGAACAYAVAGAVAAFINGDSSDTIRRDLPGKVAAAEREWINGHLDWTIDRSPGQLVSRTIASLFAAPLIGTALRQRLLDLARPHIDDRSDLHPNAGVALLGGLHALAVGLGPADDPNAALAELIRLGYDTDTVGAIAGSLLGARHGTAWIPRQQLLDLPRLERYAAALADHAAPPETQAEYLRREQDLTRQERDFQQALSKR